MPAKSIVVIGASSGIGAALARKLAGPDRYLLLMGRNTGRLTSVSSECRSRGAYVEELAADMCHAHIVDAALTSFDRQYPVDLLIANAGILDGRHECDRTESADSARRVLETNLLAPVDITHALLPAMRARRKGDLLFVTSVAAFAPLADAPAYSASKAGLMSYGLALGDALSTEGIRVFVACPGFVATAMAAIHIGQRPDELTADEAADRILRGLQHNSPLTGFPWVSYWFSRLCLILPEVVRRRGMSATRFFVRPYEQPGANG
jgi:short-subunit dehydrogenase